MRGKGVGELAAICVQAWDAKAQIGFATTQTKEPLKGDFDWTYIETVLPATAGMQRLGVLAFVVGPGEVWFDDVSVERTDRKVAPAPPRPAPGLILAQGSFDLVALEACAAPRVQLPLPLAYREQVPLTYELIATPEGALASAVIRENRPGNYVIEATFAPLVRGATTKVTWRSLVLCGDREFDGFVRATARIPAEWPAEARPWLRPTRCAQSDDERIRAVAKELRDGTDDVREIVRRVLRRSQAMFKAASGRVSELTAVEALDKQGSCTSCANLVAALLRACGVPARIFSGYPTWSGPLQTHYVVEAWLPDYGWYPLESTMGREAWQPYQQVQVAVIPPEYEDRSERRPSAAGGVPYLSLSEVVTEQVYLVGTIPDHPQCDHYATVFRAFAVGAPRTAWTASLAPARKRWSQWLTDPATVVVNGRIATARQPEEFAATELADLAR